MLYYLFDPLADDFILFNLLRYLTFRAAAGMATALFISLLFGPRVIRWLRKLRVGQVVREEGPQSHLKKAGTPTMGGALIILATLVSSMLWAKLGNWYVIISLVVLVWLGSLGFLDDYLKVVRRRSEGLVGQYKLIGQAVLGVLVGLFLLLHPISKNVETTWTGLPFFADHVLVFSSIVFVPWVMFILAGTSNAVNLTDGLDGLAGGLSAIAAGTFGVFAYLIGRTDTSAYLGLLYLQGSEELTIFCFALAGASLGFLWFNCHRADVFMGDTGSLAIGGALGVVAILLKSEFLLVIIGGVFVIEALSVMVQVGWFKYTMRTRGQGERLLLMSPLHHHFEKVGWEESKIIVRFWIVGLLCSVCCAAWLRSAR
jgi:phospho-N-acetylmuramoyl-pentapeptide-transferase